MNPFTTEGAENAEEISLGARQRISSFRECLAFAFPADKLKGVLRLRTDSAFRMTMRTYCLSLPRPQQSANIQ
jgi:hypothetical protein